MLGFAGWYDLHNGFTSTMFYFPFHNMILVGPLLYFYFQYSTSTDFRFTARHRWHLIIPALWLGLILFKAVADFTLHTPFDISQEGQFGTKGPWAEWDKSVPAILVSYLVFFYYSYLTLRSYSAYKIYIRNNFSNLENINFTWLVNIIIAANIGALVMFFFEVYSLSVTGTTYTNEWYAYLFLGFVTYYLTICQTISVTHLSKLHFINPETASTHEAPLIINPDPIEEKTKDTNDVDIAERLTLHLTEAKPYLNPELTLTDLAKYLYTNTSSLSRIINDQFKLNFNELINTFRVKAVIARLQQKDYQSHTLISIAFDSGFNSKSTFNRAFKKNIGITPIEYVRKLQAAEEVQIDI